MDFRQAEQVPFREKMARKQTDGGPQGSLRCWLEALPFLWLNCKALNDVACQLLKQQNCWRHSGFHLEIRWNPNDPRLKINYKCRHKLPLIFFYHLWKFMSQEHQARSFPRKKPEAITLKRRCCWPQGKTSDRSWTPFHYVSDSIKQKLNKLKPPPQSINLTGRLLLQLGKSLPCSTTHLWQAAWNNVPFFWNYSLQSVGCECTCSVACRKTVPSLSHFQRCTAPSAVSPH